MVTGGDSPLGQAFGRLCAERGLGYEMVGRRDVDLAEPASVDALLARMRPWAVVNTACYTRVDRADNEPAACFRQNAEAPAVLAAACARRGVRLLNFSTDLVFDGTKGTPYVERDPVAPLGVYGRSKAEGEARVLEALPSALVVRSGPLFGPWDEHDFVTGALGHLDAGLPMAVADDAVVSPTYTPDLVHACLDLLIDGEGGLWHLANGGAVTWLDLVERAAGVAGVGTECLERVPAVTMPLAMAGPRCTALGSERGTLLPSLDVALERYLFDCRVAGTLRVPARPLSLAHGSRSSEAAA